MENNASNGGKLIQAYQIRNKLNAINTFTNITAFKRSDTLPTDANKVEIQATNSLYKVYAWWDGTEVYWYCDEDEHPLLDKDLAKFFQNCNKLQDISGLEDFDSSNVEYIQGLLQNAVLINSLEVFEKWRINKVSRVEYAFAKTGIINLNGIEK